MRLRQLQVDYSMEQDRLFLRLSTDAGAEVRFWLTRRYVKLMWPAILQVAERIGIAATQVDPLAKQAAMEFEHERALQQADFSRPFEEAPRQLPLGEAPVVAARFQCTPDAGGNVVIGILPAQGQGINLAMDPVLLHSFLKLLQAAIAKSDWDVTLALPSAKPPAGAPQAPRTLN